MITKYKINDGDKYFVGFYSQEGDVILSKELTTLPHNTTLITDLITVMGKHNIEGMSIGKYSIKRV